MKPSVYEGNSITISSRAENFTKKIYSYDGSTLDNSWFVPSPLVTNHHTKKNYSDKIKIRENRDQNNSSSNYETFGSNSENVINYACNAGYSTIAFTDAVYSSIAAPNFEPELELESAFAKIEKKKAEIYSECFFALQDNDPISGQISTAEQFMLERAYSLPVKIITQVLLQIYHDYCGDEHIVSGILQMFSCVPYDNVMPEAGVMLMGVLAHKNTNLQDNAIQLFEHWNSKKCLSLLKNAKCNEVWLKKYLDEVIEYIEKEGID